VSTTQQNAQQDAQPPVTLLSRCGSKRIHEATEIRARRAGVQDTGTEPEHAIQGRARYERFSSKLQPFKNGLIR
jgi:hypothetical protein